MNKLRLKFIVSLITLTLFISCSSSDNQNDDEMEIASVSMTTSSVIGITQVKATSGGTVDNPNNLEIIEKGLVYNLNGDPTTSDNKIIDTTNESSYSINMDNLEVNSGYFVRAFATTAEGTVYGFEISFNTLEHKIKVGLVNIQDQAGIDAFGAENYSIVGGLTIGFMEGSDINNLEPLSSILMLNGDWNYSLNFLNLSNLEGLDGLRNIQMNRGGISIDNAGPIDYQMLAKIGSEEGGLRIRNESELTNLEAFSELTKLSSLDITDNENLTSLSGLENVPSLPSSVFIRRNSSLTDYCSIQNAIVNTEPTFFDIAKNLYNPSLQDFRDGNCSL